jgi:hypothetical protein
MTTTAPEPSAHVDGTGGFGETEGGFAQRALAWIERAGNKVPNPAILFIALCIAPSGSRQPQSMCIAIACSAAFLTPIATPGNMIVMGPGGYRFGDYWPFGLPFLVLFFVVAVLLVPVIWSF